MLGDPVTTGIVLGLQGASMVAREQGRRKVKKEQKNLAARETARQREFGDKSRALLNTTSAQFTPDAQLAQRGGETERWEQALNPLVASENLETTPIASSAPMEVKSEAARQLSKTLSRGKAQAKAAAQMGAYGGIQQGNEFSLGRTGQEMGRIGDFSRGSQNVLDFEMMGAHEKADPYNTASDILGTMGDLYSLYAMTGGQPRPRQVKRPNVSKLDRHLNLRY